MYSILYTKLQYFPWILMIVGKGKLLWRTYISYVAIYRLWECLRDFFYLHFNMLGFNFNWVFTNSEYLRRYVAGLLVI